MRLWLVQIKEDGWADYALRTDYSEALSVKAQQEDRGYLTRIVEVA